MAPPGASIPDFAATCLWVLGSPSFVFPFPSMQHDLRQVAVPGMLPSRVVGVVGRPTGSMDISAHPRRGWPDVVGSPLLEFFLSWLLVSECAFQLCLWSLLLRPCAPAPHCHSPLCVCVKWGPCVLQFGLHASRLFVIISLMSHHSMVLEFSLAI